MTTNLLSVIGHPIKHSLSHKIFEIIAKKEKIDLQYYPLDITPKELPLALAILKQLSFKGLNITIPHKEKIIPYIHDVSEEVQRIKAINLLLLKDGEWYGHNTDVAGIDKTFKEHRVDLTNKRVLLFGAGGAARALIYTLGLGNVKEITILNRTTKKAQNLIDYFTPLFDKVSFSLRTTSMKDYDIYIQATPLGMDGFPKRHLLRSPLNINGIFFDIVYNPMITPFLQTAKNHQAKIIDGIDMLIWQAMSSYELCVEDIKTNKVTLKQEIKNFLHSFLAS